MRADDGGFKVCFERLRHMPESLESEPRVPLVFKRVFSWWPYVFVLVSVTGLVYIALAAAR